MIEQTEEICLNARYAWNVPDPPGNVRIVREITSPEDYFVRRHNVVWPLMSRTFVVADTPPTGFGQYHAYADELTRLR